MTRNVLGEILAYKRGEIAAARGAISFDALSRRARAAGPPRGFHAAILGAAEGGGPALIAEIKKASPSRGLIRQDFDPILLARAFARGGAACLSVLTDGPSFMGSDEDLASARGAVALPCLRKEFLIDPWQVVQSRALGADAVLVILAAVEDALARELSAEAERLGMDVLVEVHDEAELQRAATLGARMIGINNRDLTSFVTDLAVTERLAQAAPAEATLVAESGVHTPDDVARLIRAGAKAMLVGESLMRHEDVEAAARALLGRREAGRGG
jgi:indole-3-glycerol phosphate synthase